MSIQFFEEAEVGKAYLAKPYRIRVNGKQVEKLSQDENTGLEQALKRAIEVRALHPTDRVQLFHGNVELALPKGKK